MFIKNLAKRLKVFGYRNHSKISLRFYTKGQIRVRFAPSPTGYLHLGGLRTALYNFLFAKKYNGKFILRIEDTDQTRLVPGAAELLNNDLCWSGIEIDEGPWQGGNFGPYMQSERLHFYKEHIHTLLNNGSAYPCFCTDRRLQLLRKEALKIQEIPKYDNKCRHLSQDEVKSRIAKGDNYCIRFKISEQEESFEDLIYGTISYNISLNEGDPVIIKTDGYPTYHFANVVDDHLMQISHVLRGVEWQISTTKHLMMYRAFGWTPPTYGHLPLLMNSDGSKLSKRQGDIKISSYRDNFIFPLALVNFISHSGGGFNKDHERYLKPKCYTIEELCNQFDSSRINAHSGKLMSEMLLEFNRLELVRQVECEESRKGLILNVRKLLKQTYPERFANDSLLISDDDITKILTWAENRIDKLPDLFSDNLKFLWTIPTSYDIGDNVNVALEALRDRLDLENQFTKDAISDILRHISKEHALKYNKFMKDLRMVISGLEEGPGVAEMIVILGKEDTIKRINLCLNRKNNLRGTA